MTQLRSVTRHMGSHSVTCYPTQVNDTSTSVYSALGAVFGVDALYKLTSYLLTYF